MDGEEIYRNMEQVAQEIDLRRNKTLAAVDDFIYEDIRPGDVTIKDLIDVKGLTKDRARSVMIKMDASPEFDKVQVYDPRVENIVAAIRPVESDISAPS